MLFIAFGVANGFVQVVLVLLPANGDGWCPEGGGVRLLCLVAVGVWVGLVVLIGMLRWRLVASRLRFGIFVCVG